MDLLKSVGKPAITIVLIRGLLREQRHWGDFPRQLQENVEEITGKTVNIITVNIAGNGDRYSEESCSSISEMVEDLRRQVSRQVGESKNIHNKLWLVALSLGGMIATEWASQYKEEIAGIVLINTSASQFSPLYHRLKFSNILAIVKAVLATSSRVRESIILSLTSNKHNTNGALLESWVNIAQTARVSQKNVLIQLCAAAAYKGRGMPPEVPILVLASQRDGLVSYKCSERIANRWGAFFFLHHSAGHDLPLDDPLWLCNHITRYIESHSFKSPDS